MAGQPVPTPGMPRRAPAPSRRNNAARRSWKRRAPRVCSSTGDAARQRRKRPRRPRPPTDLASLGLAPQPATPSAQDRQLAFLNQTPDKAHGLARSGRGARHRPNVLQAGAVISAALITGIRSDLPGQITAQVTENIYDSPPGKILLSRRARASSASMTAASVSASRVLLVWNRLIFPNGRSIVLERQPGR